MGCQVGVLTGTQGQSWGVVPRTILRERTEQDPGPNTPGSGINQSTQLFFLGSVGRV